VSAAQGVPKHRSLSRPREWLAHPLLAHPLTRGLDVDDPRTTSLRRQIIQEKSFLRRIYQKWYRMIAAAIPRGAGEVVELGSGAGFLKEYIPGLITSDLFACPGVDLVLDGQQLALADGSLRGIAMVDVLHHLPRARRFFSESARCVRPGGVIVMIEPWNSQWGRWVYTQLHHEPFVPDARDWGFPATGPLSGANGALPWIILERDRAMFVREFPQWRIRTIRPMMPFSYLVSGGVGFRGEMPGCTFDLWSGLERWLEPFSDELGMFVFAVLERTEK
jgi:SAM-dependent methyltransferase